MNIKAEQEQCVIFGGNMSQIGIKLADNFFSANCAKILREYRKIPISELKKIVENGDLLMTCDYIDGAGIKQILSLYDELSHNGFKCTLFEDNEETTLEFLNNLVNLYKEIEYQVNEEMEREAENENEK